MVFIFKANNGIVRAWIMPYKVVKAHAAENAWLVAVGGAAFAALWNLLLCQRPVELLSSGVAVW